MIIYNPIAKSSICLKYWWRWPPRLKQINYSINLSECCRQLKNVLIKDPCFLVMECFHLFTLKLNQFKAGGLQIIFQFRLSANSQAECLDLWRRILKPRHQSSHHMLVPAVVNTNFHLGTFLSGGKSRKYLNHWFPPGPRPGVIMVEKILSNYPEDNIYWLVRKYYVNIQQQDERSLISIRTHQVFSC